MIDIHTHILPEMDDGSSNVEESMKMLSMLSEQGVDTVVATPHFYADRDNPEVFLRRREEAFARLEYAPEEAPEVLLGAEVAYFDGMGHSNSLPQLQLGDSGLVLVEMPFGKWTQRMIREICDLPLQAGLTPVLAHVERYRRADQLPKYQRLLIDEGILFQCNAEAFLSVKERRWALAQLKKGAVQFLGTDTHNLTTRPPKMDQAVAVITQKLGPELPERLSSFAAKLLTK